MIYLFTTPDCKACEHVKESCDLTGVQIMDTKIIKGLAYLAWFELVADAEKGLPILLETDKNDNAIYILTGDALITRLSGEQIIKCEGGCEL